MKYGFVKIGCGSPAIRVADCEGNAAAIAAMAEDMQAAGVRIAVFPELCVSGATCGDLFVRGALLASAEQAVRDIVSRTAELDMLLLVGVPVAAGSRVYSCAAAVCRGQLLSLTAKTNIPDWGENYQKRVFAAAPARPVTVSYAGFEVPLGAGLLHVCGDMPGLVVGAEMGDDLYAPVQPSQRMAMEGATVIGVLSAACELVGRESYRRSAVSVQSARLLCACACAGAGEGESTGDAVYSGHCSIAENGALLSEGKWQKNSFVTADIDIGFLQAERRRVSGFAGDAGEGTTIPFRLTPADTALSRRFSTLPFVPDDRAELEERCEDILTMQSRALASRLTAIGCKKAVLGLSGGLDSTLALIACVRTFDYLGLDRKNIIAITMPCFGTTDRTRSNACRLGEAYGVTLREIPIAKAAGQHLSDIGHDGVTTDVTYENAQARERTQILMDIANMENGIVVGTGDLSEAALGWSTYNGDHMSMYGLNCSVPKTLIRHIVLHEAQLRGGELGSVLTDVFDTPVSPELLPPRDGDIAQKTEDIVGPYELHDFFIYHFVRRGCEPDRLYRIACAAFEGQYDGETVKKWLTVFVRRFFTQQFKRSCVPDGVKVGSVALSPRGDWRMPSDAVFSAWAKLPEQTRD